MDKRVGPISRTVKLEFKVQGLNGSGSPVPYNNKEQSLTVDARRLKLSLKKINNLKRLMRIVKESKPKNKTYNPKENTYGIWPFFFF